MFEKNKNNFHIRIKQGMEHHSNRMDIYDKGEFFYDSYRQAAYAITRIVEISRLEFEERKKQKDCHNYRRNFEYHNNIVAFCADRGQGKTSAMISMSDALRNMSAEKNGRIDKDKEREKRDFWTNAYDFIPDSSNPSPNPVLDTHFECLPIIDPTCLEKNDSILRTVISRMFQSASQKWQDSSNCSSSMYRNAGKEKQRQKEELANKFLKCFKGLDYLYKEEKKEISSYYDDLNMVAEYGDSNNFKTMFMDLVESYLQFISFSNSDPCYSDTKNTMMVILIDDADLNTKRAFSIVEEIQKYFVIPGVLILMALHVGTLARTLEQNQLEQYKTLINYSNDPTIKERCHRAMERYIEKLFPSSHRIYLPDISKVIEQDCNFVKLSYWDEQKKDILKKYEYLVNSKFTDDYENRLFLLIYAKTGIILTKHEDILHESLHEFLPSNFRQLNHFLFYLNSMEDIVDENDDDCSLWESVLKKGKPERINLIFAWLKNLNIFQDYFLHAWCPERLTAKQLRVIMDIHNSYSNVKKFNTVQFIKEIIQEDRNCWVDNVADLREQQVIGKEYTSMADVTWALYRMKHSVKLTNSLSFLYAVKMYYTIYIHITFLQGMLSILQSGKSEPSPLKIIRYTLGGRIFPMHYYSKKKLPFHILNISFPVVKDGVKHDIENKYKDIRYVFDRFLYKCDQMENIVGILSIAPKCKYFVDFRNYPIENNETSQYQFFDFFAPIINSLKDDSVFSEECQIYDPSVLCSVLNLICNYDLQEVVYKNYFKIPYTMQERPTGDLFTITHEIYKQIDIAINERMIIKVQSNLENLIDKKDVTSLYADYPILQTIGKSIGNPIFWNYINSIPENQENIIVQNFDLENQLPEKEDKPEISGNEDASTDDTKAIIKYDTNKSKTDLKDLIYPDLEYHYPNWINDYMQGQGKDKTLSPIYEQMFKDYMQGQNKYKKLEDENQYIISYLSKLRDENSNLQDSLNELEKDVFSIITSKDEKDDLQNVNSVLKETKKKKDDDQNK